MKKKNKRNKNMATIYIEGIITGAIIAITANNIREEKRKIERQERLNEITEEFDVLLDIIVDKVEQNQLKRRVDNNGQEEE